MLLMLKTWPEVEAYLTNKDLLIVPIGSTEQHGPTGLIGTDAICAEALAKAVGEKTGSLVGPTINVGMAQHHLAFPGSISLRPSTLVAYIKDYVFSLSKNGFKRFFFINGHGGNTASIKAAFSEIGAEFSFGEKDCDLHLQLVNWYEPEAVAHLREEMFADGEGSHATPSELALTWHLYPEFTQSQVLDPQTAPRGSFRDAADLRNKFPDGRIGSDPSQASPVKGANLFDCASKALVEACMDFSKS